MNAFTEKLLKSRALALAICSLLALASTSGSARAADRHYGGHPVARHVDHREFRGHRVYTGGYYAAPPVVYGGPAYAPPPVVYAAPEPGIGLNINIR